MALFVFERGVSRLAIFFVIVLLLDKMDDNIFNAVNGLGIKEINGVFWSRQMTIHAVRYKSLGVVHMGGRLPCVVGKLDFVTHGTKLGRRRADHGIVGHAEQRKGNEYAKNDQTDTSEILFHFKNPFSNSWMFG